jgi:hypothetical protein
MKRPAQIRRLAFLLPVVGYSRLSFAYQPMVCYPPAVMQDELARYQNACLFDANGSQDALYNHMAEFLDSGSATRSTPASQRQSQALSPCTGHVGKGTAAARRTITRGT